MKSPDFYIMIHWVYIFVYKGEKHVHKKLAMLLTNKSSERWSVCYCFNDKYVKLRQRNHICCTPNPFPQPTQLGMGICRWKQKPTCVSNSKNSRLRSLKDNCINMCIICISPMRYCIWVPSAERVELWTCASKIHVHCNILSTIYYFHCFTHQSS